MRKVLVALLVASTLGLAVSPNAARAGDGNVAAGIFGGMAAGALLGAAASQPRYYAPAPVYVEPAPIYEDCYWTRGRPVFDRYRGIWYRPRVQVCD